MPAEQLLASNLAVFGSEVVSSEITNRAAGPVGTTVDTRSPSKMGATPSIQNVPISTLVAETTVPLPASDLSPPLEYPTNSNLARLPPKEQD